MDLSPRARKLWPIGVMALSVGAAWLAPRAWHAVTAAAQQSAPPAPAQVPPSPSAPPPDADIRGTTWRWQQTVRNDGTTIVVQEPSRYTIQFLPNGQLAIRADCNQVIGRYTVDGRRLTLQLGPSTLVGCPPDSQADPFVRDLQMVSGFTLSGEELRLELGTGNGTMIFAPIRSLPSLGAAHLTPLEYSRLSLGPQEAEAPGLGHRRASSVHPQLLVDLDRVAFDR